MLWEDLIVSLSEALGQDVKDKGRFTPTRARLLMHEVQSDIAEYTKCVETSNINSITSGTKTYSLPTRCISVQYFDLSGYPPPVQIERIPVRATEITGVPTGYYIGGEQVTFDPTPNINTNYTIAFFARPVEYAFRITHARGNNSSTAATFTTTSTTIALTITGGTDAGTDTINLALAATDTVAEVVSAINALGKGFTATAHPDAAALVFTTEGVDVRSGVDIEGINDYVFFRPRIPTMARDLLVLGATERFKFKDREITYAQYQQGMYYQKREEFKKMWWARKMNMRNPGVLRVRRGRGRGKYYRGESGFPIVYIP